MHLFYYEDEPPDYTDYAIFLAGPSPRTPDVKSWRPEAISLLEKFKYREAVFIPESRPGLSIEYNWELAPHWEHEMIDRADVILFWVPRDIRLTSRSIEGLAIDLALKTKEEITQYLENYEVEMRLPGFTTNIEFGWLSNSTQASVLGHPLDTPHTGYFKFMADKLSIPMAFSLEETIKNALWIY